MKNLTFTFIALFFSVCLLAQTPQSFRYQAVARDNSGNVLANQSVSFRISILSGNVSGTEVYKETHTGKTTNAFGLVELEIGKGTPVNGTFSAINWSNNSYYVKIEMDPVGGTAYQVLSTSQLLSVPYALHAKTVETGDNWGNSYVRTDATLTGQGTVSTPLKIAQQSATSGQVLKWNGTNWIPAIDETGTSPFTSSGGITSNTPITDNFVFGSSSMTDVAGTADDVRMLFNKYTGAFRAGEAKDTEWDNISTGSSVASAAFGYQTNAADMSVAAGRFSNASGFYSTAFGTNTIASGTASTALGGATKALGETSTSLGYQTIAAAKSSLAIGQNNIGAGTGGTWVPTDPVFEIGIGASDTERANAMTVLKNGNVGIGMNPWNDARLSVNGKSMAGLYALNTGTSSIAIGVLSEAIGSGNTQIGIKGYAEHGTQNTGVEGFVSSTGNINFGIYGYADSGNTNFAVYGEVPDGPNNFAGFFDGNGFFGGNLGIGAYPPLSKLDVNGQIRIRGGSPGTGKVLTSDINGVASWQTPTNTLILPYFGNISVNESPAFTIQNNGFSSSIIGNSLTTSNWFTSGVEGTSEGPSSAGVSGIAKHTTGPNYGVRGISNSELGCGIYGSANASTGITFGIKGAVVSSSGYSGYFSGGKVFIEGNTGIGTENPNAKLEVAGQVKITGGSPGAGKVLTSDANGLATWQTPPELYLPLYREVASDGWVFSISNSATTDLVPKIAILGSSDSGTGVQGQHNSDTGIGIGIFGSTRSSQAFSGFFQGGKFYISGNTGIGTENPGAKLEVAGQVKITGGNPGTGKVLTSDASGLASWQILPLEPWVTAGNNIYYNNGFVGIGTTTPSQKLHIKGSAPGNAVLLIEPNKWNAIGDYGELRLGDANHYIRGEYSKGMTFKDVNQFFFDGGNVGIGTDSPSAKLEISSSDGPQIKITDTTNDGGRPGIQFTGNSSHYISGDDGSNEHFGIYSVWGNSRIYDAKLCVYGKATSSWGKYIGFTHDGTNGIIDTDAGYIILSPSAQRVGINTTNPAQSLDVVGNTHISGNLGIGTTSPSQKLDVNGNVRIRSIASGAYYSPVNRTSDGTLTTATSDIRLKENIYSLENSLEKVIQLRGVTFTWKTKPEFGRQIGFIAQEFEKVIPELVFTNETDGYKGINYAEISAVLVEAIKELNAENNRLKIKNEQIEAENRQIRTENTKIISRLEKIEALISYSVEK